MTRERTKQRAGANIIAHAHRNGPAAGNAEHHSLATEQELARFLAEVERRAFKHASFALRDPHAALDVVQEAMMRLASRYAAKPVEELPLLFQRILQNAIRDHFRRQKVRSLWTALLSSLTPAEQPDADPPALRLHRPADGATFVKPGTAIGLSFDELLEPRSAHPGSVRVWDAGGAQVPGRLYVLEGVVNFAPDAPLAADQSYFVEVPAGGVADSAGNAVAEATRFSFSTGGEVAPWPRDP